MTHDYSSTGTYTITLSLTGGSSRWIFTGTSIPLVPQSGTTADNIYISSMPALSDYFGMSATNVGDYFFRRFNGNGALTSLPVGSFDTSEITAVGSSFFTDFNKDGYLTSLPS
jgi:surface protein